MKVLFFAPYAALWPHAFPEALVANELKRHGAEISYIGCGGEFKNNCLIYSATGITSNSSPAQKQKVCYDCANKRKLLTDGLGVVPERIEDYLTADDRSQIEAHLAGMTREKIDDLILQDLPVGRIALHEIILNHKLTAQSEMTEPAYADYLEYLRNTLAAFFAARHFLSRIKPDRIVVYNSHYATNQIVARLAQQQDIPVFSLHAGGNMADRFSTLMVMPRGVFPFYQQMKQTFEDNYAEQPASRRGLQVAFDHFRALTQARTVFVYSAPKSQKFFDMRAFFSIQKTQKVILATLSSYDEMFACLTNEARQPPAMAFATQIEWMQALIAFIKTRPELFLVIRVHPREFPNRRENVHSTHARRLAEALKDLPSNVRINWPTDGISLYDLATETDVVLNGWSSAGKEMSMLGLPVVVYSKEAILYPSILNYIGLTASAYFQQIDRALNEGWSFDRIVLAYRWLAMEYTTGTVDISDGFKFSEIRKPLPVRAIRKMYRILFPYAEQRSDLKAFARPLRDGQHFVQAIIGREFVPEFKHAARKPLAKNEEVNVITGYLERIVRELYSDPAYQQTKLVRNLAKAISTHRQM